ncbi:MAG: hypothetical protein D6702_03850 [Planctomycetota bacterium]|nr:MAG: hypothetical protein D6702_03850 [Planctomycetota bacterium]
MLAPAAAFRLAARAFAALPATVGDPVPLDPDPAGAAATMTPFGAVFVAVVWALLLCLNGWCLRRLLRRDGGDRAS